MDVRQPCLDATANIVAEEGLFALSPERVGERAGVPASLVREHYATNEALLEALIERQMGGMDEFVAARMAEGASFGEAYIDAMFCPEKGPTELMAGFVAAVTLMPSLRPIISRRTGEWFQRLREDGVSESAARMLTFVGHGHYVSTNLGVVRLSEGENERLRHQLKRSLRPSEDELLAGLFAHALERADAAPNGPYS